MKAYKTFKNLSRSTAAKHAKISRSPAFQKHLAIAKRAAAMALLNLSKKGDRG